METTVQKNPSSQTLEITLTAEAKQELEHFITEKGWETAEGYRILLGAGLGYLRSQPYQEAESDSEAEREKKQLMARLIQDESTLASMRFRMFELQQTNTNWELSTGAVFNENTALKKLVKRQAREIQSLKARLESVERELEKCKTQTL